MIESEKKTVTTEERKNKIREGTRALIQMN